MNPFDTDEHDLTPFPYEGVTDSATAVQRFFLDRVLIRTGGDPIYSEDLSLRQEVAEWARTTVASRQQSTVEYFGDREIKFVFQCGEEDDAYFLAKPGLLVRFVSYAFACELAVMRDYNDVEDLATTQNESLVLRVTNDLVTFGGQVVWVRSQIQDT